jgi:hypothetical protein
MSAKIELYFHYIYKRTFTVSTMSDIDVTLILCPFVHYINSPEHEAELREQMSRHQLYHMPVNTARHQQDISRY